MALTLVYHKVDSPSGSISPFDTAIMKMVEGQELCIACPYLGVGYLKRMVARATNWRLLTDVPECLASARTEASRDEIIDVFMGPKERTHHCRDLHAKILIAGTQALFGSANFTAKGITGRTEMAVVLDDAEQVQELREWFDRLWELTGPVDRTDLERYVEKMPPPRGESSSISIPCRYPGIRSVLQPGLDVPKNPPGKESSSGKTVAPAEKLGRSIEGGTTVGEGTPVAPSPPTPLQPRPVGSRVSPELVQLVNALYTAFDCNERAVRLTPDEIALRLLCWERSSGKVSPIWILQFGHAELPDRGYHRVLAPDGDRPAAPKTQVRECPELIPPFMFCLDIREQIEAKRLFDKLDPPDHPGDEDASDVDASGKD